MVLGNRFHKREDSSSLYKMFVATLIFAFAITHVTAEIPSYIQVCGRKNPDINKCIINSVLGLKDKICDGIPELDVPQNEPAMIGDLIISNTSNNKIFLQKLYLRGMCDYKINSLRTDLEKNQFDVDLTFKRIEINATYDVDIRILVPIATQGPVFIVSENVSAKAQLNFKTVTRNGKKYNYMSAMKVDLDIKGYDIQYGALTNAGLERFQGAIAQVIGNNQKEIIDTIKPAIERVVSEQILRTANQIIKHFTYDELFPDRA